MMNTKRYGLNIRCNNGKVFSIETYLDEATAAYLNDNAAMIEKEAGSYFNHILYSIPAWCPVGLWCLLADLFYMRKPWGGQ